MVLTILKLIKFYFIFIFIHKKADVNLQKKLWTRLLGIPIKINEKKSYKLKQQNSSIIVLASTPTTSRLLVEVIV